ncbi:MAG: hypothetical protein ACKO8H_23350, partial [Microcystis panniformis]
TKLPPKLPFSEIVVGTPRSLTYPLFVSSLRFFHSALHTLILNPPISPFSLPVDRVLGSKLRY